MTIALLSDIHGNREALEACLTHARAQGCERFVFLGDCVGYGADPAWVVDTLAELVSQGCAVALQGNHDELASMAASPERDALERSWHPQILDTIHWARAQLSEPQRRFLRELPLTARDGPSLYVHANGWDPAGFEYLLGPDAARRSIQAVSERLTFCGHVHDPIAYHMGLTNRVEMFRPTPGTPLALSAVRRWAIIPGSVGQPRDGNPAAAYASFDEVNQLITFWRLPYDHYRAAQRIRAAGLPERFARQLIHGC
jgi:diadenosine tetraphosphatase ApaH/serine/threonine PP2A family protein phosphatase